VSRSQASRGYLARIYGSSSQYSCDIIKWTAAGVYTVLKSLSNLPLTNGQTYTIELETINNFLAFYIKDSSDKYLSSNNLWASNRNPILRANDSTYTNGGISILCAGVQANGWSADNFNYTYNTIGVVNTVCVGDSLTLGNHASASYPSLLPPILNSKFLVSNQGINSVTLTGLISNGATIDALYQSGKDNVLIVWGGTNDIYFGDSGPTAYNDLVTYCNARKSTGWTIILLNILSRSDTSTPSDFLDNRAVFNDLIDSNWKSFADSYIDLTKDARIGLNGSEMDTTYFTSDRVHLNATGNQIIADYVATILLSGF
jgi:lysophospholipase L1-like esterase